MRIEAEMLFEQEGRTIYQVPISADDPKAAYGLIYFAFEHFRNRTPPVSLWDDGVSVRFQRRNSDGA